MRLVVVEGVASTGRQHQSRAVRWAGLRPLVRAAKLRKMIGGGREMSYRSLALPRGTLLFQGEVFVVSPILAGGKPGEVILVAE